MSDLEIQIITPPVADDCDPLESALIALVEAIEKINAEAVAHGCLGGEFGYGARYENDVFAMRPDYQDAACDCGANERGEKWHSENPHASSCFRVELDRRFALYDEESGYNAADAASHAPGTMIEHNEVVDSGTAFWTERTPLGEAAHKAWRIARDKRDKQHEKITNELYVEYGLPISRFQWHCTCGVKERAKIYFDSEGAHSKTCALELPNFLHKKSGLEVRWYKWIGRETKVVIPPGTNIQQVFQECLDSLRRAGGAND